MNKTIITTAAFLGMLAVINGAFGAHALKAKLEPQQLQVWGTAVQYNFYHIFALLALAALNKTDSGLTYASFWLFTLGIVFFSGSLYLLSCRAILQWDWLRILGPITPIGGLLFIAGWITLALSAIKAK
ncbi:DUF423 domain-containing protein [Mucilaginibacter terrae]|uniref:Uncharacterized membrane protein YgdD (TMEM256/DUF423 family) n=1 Tax=Mucilaginibacter terrae TaxID=1955052 RepID=A0ABU3H0P2_9SPHI|nr:DUF423 domain-containing protein [Mucilaginibacter terrae]MDT3405583.1 uncharacterized membrane protein YgdD (TMEM256/DUF423 family) [Mucilaginibacter terrae]